MTDTTDETKPMFARETRFIQARDLAAFSLEHSRLGHALITVKIDAKWREVYEVWADEKGAADTFGDDAEYTKEIIKWVDRDCPCWVIVRYLVEENSDDYDIADALHKWRTCDLVEVQVPVLLTMPPANL